MDVNLIIASLLVVAVASSVALQAKGVDGIKDEDLRIIGGLEAIPHSIKYQAHLTLYAPNNNHWLCGGSVISNKVILTAAHCLDEAAYAQVLLGAHNRLIADPSTQQIQYSNNFVIHPSYNPATLQSDIALIRLNSTITFNAYVQKVLLPVLGNHNDYEGQLSRVSGWGRTSCSSTAMSAVLRYLDMTVLSNTYCASPVVLISPTLCASTGTGAMPSTGDDGGPLVLRLQSARAPVQIGIYSFSSCFASGAPAIFTRVSTFRFWIELYL